MCLTRRQRHADGATAPPPMLPISPLSAFAYGGDTSELSNGALYSVAFCRKHYAHTQKPNADGVMRFALKKAFRTQRKAFSLYYVLHLNCVCRSWQKNCVCRSWQKNCVCRSCKTDCLLGYFVAVGRILYDVAQGVYFAAQPVAFRPILVAASDFAAFRQFLYLFGHLYLLFFLPCLSTDSRR